ncbi:hypothetical protein BCR37DRAFT_375827 [Protomyces lactucae-debilis]|uniref:Uncharacterized protein n=1 Tax=Protomyces lactucae-debilis TaxID=2754530 RepID=A0A1Y2FV72_PROLT|nr:uncharacterized protein BCR37DRAFT_375827 [Protomyces lactucae-debilis]ORY87869.1 hypothetical protein BCR37DRAFT_375827 [Protomyces lactucae-debilis]
MRSRVCAQMTRCNDSRRRGIWIAKITGTESGTGDLVGLMRNRGLQAVRGPFFVRSVV